MSIWCFFLIAISWYSHFVYASFFWFHVVIYLYSTRVHWAPLGSLFFSDRQFIALHFFRVGLCKLILFLCLGHVFLFLCVHYFFVVFSAVKEIATSSRLYGLPFYRRRLSQFNLMRESGGPLNLLWGCVFSGIVYAISQRACQFFRSLQSLPPSGVCLWYCRFSGATISHYLFGSLQTSDLQSMLVLLLLQVMGDWNESLK